MALEEYVPVTGDDWYQRRRQDAEGRFWRRVSDQGPRGGHGDSTRQGIYCFTADGQLLFYRNGQSAEAMKLTLQRGLEAWRKLPESRRKPGAISVEDFGELDANYARTPPPGGLVLNVFTRLLEKQAAGLFEAAECPAGAGGEAARDHLWITREELQALVPADARVGQVVEVPRTLRERIVRFHLVDDTRGEPPHWQPGEIRAAEMKLTVVRSDAEQAALRLDGSALVSTHAELEKSRRGYDAKLLGYLTFDRKTKTFRRFDVIALGEHWGEGQYTPGARPGRAPLGVLFEIATGDSPANQVPPQGARMLDEYLGRARTVEARR